MKRFLFAITLLSWSCYSFCQSNDPMVKTRAFYLQKSHHERRIGEVMVCSGALLYIIGTFSQLGEPLDDDINTHRSSVNGGAVAAVGGLGLIAGSIPFYIIAGKNKRKATHASLDLQKSAALLRTGGINHVFQPALTLSFDLSKRKRKD